jgi:uncharacterized protein YndB with AHSA1/START domain
MVDHIEKSIELKASISRVWRALTDYRQFSEWFRVKLDGPFVEGQVSTGHMTYPGYEHVKWEAVVEKIEPERLFSFTWPQIESHDRERYSEDYKNAPRTTVEFRLEKIPQGTRLTVTESGFDRVPERFRLEAFRRNEGGWIQQLRNVETYVTQAA